jgi:peptidylprolyl isomerase
MRRLLVVCLVLLGCNDSLDAREPKRPTAASPAAQPAAVEVPPAPVAASAARTPPSLPEASDANPPNVRRLDGPVHREGGISFVDEVVGSGAQPQTGQAIKVHYTGWLTDGTKFDSSRDRGEPIVLSFDSGQVIKGWDLGLASMRVGGKRRLIIPPELGYGEHGAGNAIPPDATLVFDVELIEIVGR